MYFFLYFGLELNNVASQFFLKCKHFEILCTHFFFYSLFNFVSLYERILFSLLQILFSFFCLYICLLDYQYFCLFCLSVWFALSLHFNKFAPMDSYPCYQKNMSFIYPAYYHISVLRGKSEHFQKEHSHGFRTGAVT